MVLSTPTAIYDEAGASKVLLSIGEDKVHAASNILTSRGVITKVVRDKTREIPGRTIKISEPYVSCTPHMNPANRTV